MNVLFVTYDIPYPLDSGGKIRAFYLIKYLAQKHNVTLFTYYRDNSQLDNIEQLEKFCSKIRLFRRMKAFSFDHISSTLAHPSLTAHISHYYHTELKRELKKELGSGDYKILHLESFYTSYLLDGYPAKKVLGTENIESDVYMKHASKQPLWLRLPLQLEAVRTRKYEENSWKRADVVLAVSQSNVKRIKKKSGKFVYLVPNGVDLDFFQFKPKSKIDIHPKILYVGNFSYLQNRDAADYLIKEIFPLIEKKLGSAELILVGKDLLDYFSKYNSSKIHLMDNIADIRKAYYLSDILVAPLRASSGSQFKLLEAMATGIPVVTTPLAADGLKVINGVHLLTGTSTKDIAKHVENLVRDVRLRRSLIENARNLIKIKYSWNVIGNKLLKIYEQLY